MCQELLGGISLETGFWVTPLTSSSPLAIFLSSFPARFLRIMFGTPCSAFPPLSIHSLGTGWVPPPTHQLFLPRSPVSIESSSYVVAFDTTEHLTPPPQPDGFCDGSSSASDTHFSVLLVCSSFCNGWVPPPSILGPLLFLFHTLFLGGFIHTYSFSRQLYDHHSQVSISRTAFALKL